MSMLCTLIPKRSRFSVLVSSSRSIIVIGFLTFFALIIFSQQVSAASFEIENLRILRCQNLYKKLNRFTKNTVLVLRPQIPFFSEEEVSDSIEVLKGISDGMTQGITQRDST